MDYTATYSPEDNKLRLYSLGRLPSDLYARVRAAGFIYAPKQELFVAPMWTPDREDLLLELCGEIGDEDKSLVERAEERADRFRDYSHARAEDADQAHKAVAAIADNIPLGQPILVGHHSERRARKDAERIENGMRRAVKMWETSEYWKDRARGAIGAAKYKERPDVRARRIKKLEAEKRGYERYKAKAQQGLRFWEGKLKLKNSTTGESRPLEITEANRETLIKVTGSNDIGNIDLPRKEGDKPDFNQHPSVYTALSNSYPTLYAPRTVAECQAVALEHYPKVIARWDRWITHYDNRLTYERTMLAEEGGTVADQKKPEVGGACKCWVGRGNWLEIQKVNKVSVAVLDNWGNGGSDFLRTVTFDKLTAIMSKSEFEAMKAGGQVKATAAERQEGWAEREHAAAVANKPHAYVNSNPDGFDSNCAVCDGKARDAIHTPKLEADIKAMKETLRAGVQVVTAPNLFPTPPSLAERMAEIAFEHGWGVQVCAEMNDRCRILEPSAGTGNIVDAIRKAGETTASTLYELVCIEINSRLVDAMKLRRNQEAGKDFSVLCSDFLTCNGSLGKFDRILMNPPFDHGSDIAHIKHAMTFLAPGGRLVAICANGPRQQEELQPLSSQWIDLEPGTFKDQGTNVNTALIVIDN